MTEEQTAITRGGPGDPLSALFRFHAKIRGALQMLGELGHAPRVETEERLTAEGLLRFFEGPLMWHDLDEEASLLPRLRRVLHRPEELEVLRVIGEDHDKMEGLIDAILPDLRDVAAGHAGKLKELSALKLKLAAVLQPHLRLEERRLFPLARDTLTPDDLVGMKREIDARDLLRQRGQSAAIEIPYVD